MRYNVLERDLVIAQFISRKDAEFFVEYKRDIIFNTKFEVLRKGASRLSTEEYNRIENESRAFAESIYSMMEIAE